MATELTDVSTLEAGHQGARQVSASQLMILYELKKCSIKMCCEKANRIYFGDIITKWLTHKTVGIVQHYENNILNSVIHIILVLAQGQVSSHCLTHSLH